MNFLGMGPMELMLILVLALIVFGPGKLPEIAGQVGKAVRDLRRATTDLSGEFNRTLSLELEEKKEAQQAAAARVAPAAVHAVETAPVTTTSVAPASETTTTAASTADTTPIVSAAEPVQATVDAPPPSAAEAPSTTVAASDATTTSGDVPGSVEEAARTEVETSSSSWEERWNPPPAPAEASTEPTPNAPAEDAVPVAAASAEGPGDVAPKKAPRTRTRTSRKSTPAGPIDDAPPIEDLVAGGANGEVAAEEAAPRPAPAKPRKPRAPRRKTDASTAAAGKEVADPARS